MIGILVGIFAPFVAGLLIIVFGERLTQNIREAITFLATLITFGSVVILVMDFKSGMELELNAFRVVEGIDFYFKVDGSGLLFASVASLLWIIASIYSVGYMRGHQEKNQTGYYSAFATCIGTTIGLCFAGNLFVFFIFYEILTIATYPLVVHYRDEKGKSSGRKYLVYTLVSGQLFFVGIAFIYLQCGTVDFVPGGFIKVGDLSNTTGLILFFLLVVSGLVKAGVMPLHSWLPAAMVAPTPVSALLHAVAVVKAGAFCIIRIMCYVFDTDFLKAFGGAEILTWVAALTIILSSLIAMKKDNLKARLAFSTIGQLSYIVLGIALLTPVSVTGAMYHIVAHAFMKITLFMCAGGIFVTTHKQNISEMVGIGKRMPITMGAFTVASFGIAGLPFVVGFVSKMNIMQGALMAGKPVFAGVLVASALLAVTYLIPIGVMAFKKDSDQHTQGEYGEANKWMLIPIVAGAVLAVTLGIMPNFGLNLFDLAQDASLLIFGGGK
ncbi:MAG: monovalent cation/H+ antiporter subunit D family protein [Anaerovoracaceae bacterium]